MIALTVPARADVVTEQLDIEQPRQFGYLLGDKFARTIKLRLRKPYVLKRETLPVRQRITPWLATESALVSETDAAASHLYEIRLEYQIVNLGDAQRIDVPAYILMYSDGHETLQALVPATWVTVSPLTNPGDHDIQPAHPPRIIPYHPQRIAIIAALMAGAILSLLYLHWGVLGIGKQPPFTAALRQLRRGADKSNGAQSQTALRIVHRAFNLTAGKTVFVESLAEFFTAHPGFVTLQDPIQRFFMVSRQFFYRSDGIVNEREYTLAELLVLVRRCAEIERGRG